MNTHNLRRATRPKIDNEGFSKGKIECVESDTGTQIIKKGRDTTEREYAVYNFHFLVDGVSEDLNIKMQTAININDVPISTTGKGKQTKNKYNRITTVCLRLGFVKEEELPTLDDKRINEIDSALKKIKDLPVAFKISRNEKGFLNIDPESIKPLIEQATKSTKVEGSKVA